MSVMEDLISFDIIEGQKENIQSLPQGRSAKALAAQYGPTPFSPVPTPGATRTLNDAIRQEYELELQGIADADDPLDIYDRYVKWTMNAYPSAQATPESQLRPLLERATRTFQGSAQYKNDVRYLKLWFTYVRFFSDAPRETYAYLSRHGIGDGLALFYEEFAAWLEGAGRWTQAEEVYKLGLEREARPQERLLRKFGEFQKRFEIRPENTDEPTSPALPTVRPALAAKLDPFASSTPRDPQAPQGVASGNKPKSGRAKMAIFSDADGTASRPGSGGSDRSRGWDSIGTIAERKKENVMEAKPWAGEVLKGGKKAGGPKMMVFKDQSQSNATKRPIYISTSKGKTERWFADIVNVCPNENDPTDEYCFEELRARSRGLLDRKWTPQRKPSSKTSQLRTSGDGPSVSDETTSMVEATQTLSLGDDSTMPDVTLGMGGKKPRTKKKTMEVKSETQTIKAVLDSPTTKTKVKRRKSVAQEPTMTLHTRAATDDVLDIFNQPLRNVGPIGSNVESDGDTTDYDVDDYTCGVSSVGDNTRTGNLSETGSEYNDDETEYETQTAAESTQPESVSPWSEFSTGRHVPNVDLEQNDTEGSTKAGQAEPAESDLGEDLEEGELITPIQADGGDEPHTRYLPDIPKGALVEAPTMPFRTAEQAAQSRLPFMTPIVEMTECSMGLPTIRGNRDYFCSKTPSRRKGDVTEPIQELISSPLQDIVNEARPAVDKIAGVRLSRSPATPVSPVAQKEPIVTDRQVNPHDEPLRSAILAAADMESFATYHDMRSMEFKRCAEVRKFVKSQSKVAKPVVEKTSTVPPVLHFEGEPDIEYVVKRELGKGAYAPVYLASVAGREQPKNPTSLVAIKSEDPPSPWEYYVLSILHARLALSNSRVLASFTKPHAFHHFADEVYLMESYHSQGTLLDLVNLVRSEPSLTGSANPSSAPPGLDESVAMFFAIELLRTVESMHETGILHGDLKADNCLVRLDPTNDSAWTNRYDASGNNGWSDKGVVLIDLGRGIDMTVFRKDVSFIADWKTSNDDCVEMRELRPWTYQVDYWGAAGVLHVLLFGKWIEDVVDSRDKSKPEDEENADDKTMAVGKAGVKRRKLKESLKRYWQTELWSDVFDVLMNPTVWVAKEPTGQMPVQKRLVKVRVALEKWLEGNSEKRALKTQLKRLEDRIREKRRRD